MSYNKFKKFNKYTKKTNEKKDFNKGISKYLIIVESPSKCGKIESYLGLDYKCIASMGHFREVDTFKNYDVKYKYIESKESHINFMKSIISQYPKENIILATDDDREGESIAWHLCDVFNLSIESTKRIKFNEITQNAIKKSVENPEIINMKLVNSQKARQILDIIVGYKISPMLWKYAYNGKNNSLSACRCQTPALRLIYDNYLKGKDNVEQHSYKITGWFLSKNIEFTLNKELEGEKNTLDFLKKSVIFQHKLSIASPRQVLKVPPEPFNTSKLLQYVNQTLHYSPSDTMSLCQKLYQDGYITYMRTENKKYSEDFLEKANSYIEIEFGEDYKGDNKKIQIFDTTNPHEAIRVTDISRKKINSESRMDTLYNLIWRNTVESCMNDALYSVIDCEITAPDKMKYKNIIESPIFLGWKKLKSDINETELQNSNRAMLLYLETISKQNENVKYNKIKSIETIHLKHSHYNESGLIKKLEELEIGRPSTFATFVDTIQQRGYVKKQDIEGKKIKIMDYELEGESIKKIKGEKVVGNEKNKLVIQTIGLVVIEFLIKHFEDIFSYDYTKEMESELDNILQGIIEEWNEICKNCEKKIKELIKPLKDLKKETYELDENKELIFSQYGPSIRITLEDGSVEYKSVKKSINLDLEKLKNKEYNVDDLIEVKEKYLGKYEDLDVYVKLGMYGVYAEWGENKKTLNSTKKKLENITLEDFESVLTKNSDSNILRTINENISVRKGKYGPYVYYKRKDMSKPEFYNIKKFKEGFTYCKEEVLINWLNEQYNIPLNS